MSPPENFAMTHHTPSLRVASAFLVLAAASPLGSCSSAPPKPPLVADVPAVPVQLVPVLRGLTHSVVRASGVLGSQRELELSFKLAGIVRSVLVDEGARVRKGQLMATMDATEVTAQLRQTRDSLAKAELDLTRASKLRQQGTIAVAAAENAKINVDLLRSASVSASFAVQQARLRAPEDGVIDRRMVEVGEVVGPGHLAFRVLANGNGPVARVALIDREVLEIKVGAKANVRLDARPEQPFAAHVSRVGSSASRTTGTFEVELAIDDPLALELPSGLTVKAEIERDEEHGLTIPAAAIVQGAGEEAFVYVVKDGRARKHAVQVRQILEGRVLVAKGLEGVDQVVEAGSALLQEGTLVSAKD